MSRSRISRLERDLTSPTASERQILSKKLNLYPPPMVRHCREFRANASEILDNRPYYPPSDRPAYNRFLEAKRRHPRIVASLVSKIKQRSDFLAIEKLCSRLSLDSWLEALYVLVELALGAKPALLCPARLGRIPREILNPVTKVPVGHRMMPALVRDGQAVFFNVTFQPGRVDILRWSDHWEVVELDGAGHDCTRDKEREEAIQLPFVRLSTAEVEAMATALVT